MLREARLLEALQHTEVPVSSVLAKVPVGEVLDVAFYVMTYVRGPVITTSTPDTLATPETRYELGEALVDTLAALHTVDWRRAGLAEVGRPEGFNARHVDRMGALVAQDGQPPAAFAALDAWLRANVPAESGAAIIHNDFRLGNVIVDAQAPGRVRAVLDWELATLGDPLFDLAYFLISVPQPDTQLTPTEEMGTAMLEEGWPSRSELAQRYAARTGADLTDLSWYEAMALWKLAVLYEYGRRRAVAGKGDPYYGDPSHVELFLAAAHRVAGLSVASI